MTCCTPTVEKFPSGLWACHANSCPEHPGQKIARVREKAAAYAKDRSTTYTRGARPVVTRGVHDACGVPGHPEHDRLQCPDRERWFA